MEYKIDGVRALINQTEMNTRILLKKLEGIIMTVTDEQELINTKIGEQSFNQECLKD